MIPPDVGANYIDRNIRLLVGNVRSRERLAEQQESVASAYSPSLSGKRVLILEDRLLNQTVIQKQLKKLGVDCMLVANGVKGLEMLDRQRFDLILCDCSMPVMNGYEFTRALRQQESAQVDDRRVPVIALTANAFREDVDRCLENGMDDFISKPVTMDRLAAMLAGIDFANRARGSSHIKYEWRRVARNANGNRIRAHERFCAAMRMNKSFAFRHRETDQALTRPPLTVVPDHPDVTAISNRYRDNSRVFHGGSRPLQRGLGNKWTQPLLSVHAQDGIRSPDVLRLDSNTDEAFLDAGRQHRQTLQSMGMMAAQITFGQNVRLNRALRGAGSKPGEDVND